MPELQLAPSCAACGQEALISVADGPPWCEHCEWNLDCYEQPAVGRPSWLARRAHRLAFALNAGTYEQLLKKPAMPARWTRSAMLLSAVSVIFGAGMLALIGIGLDLLLTRGLGFKLLGALLVLIGIELRPRLARLDRSLGLIDRAGAPALFAIVDEVAAAIGAPRIELMVLDESYSAWCGRFGLRQRLVLGVGLPLWGALGPQARVALLAHELGHLVNRDPVRGLLSRPAVITCYRLADLLDLRGLHQIHSRRAVAHALVDLVGRLLLAPICFALRWTAHLLAAAAARDHRRAEFYADALAIAAGGYDGMRELLGCLLFDNSVRTAIRRTGSVEASAWHAAAKRAVGAHAANQRRVEQHSMRVEASLLGSHPPTGLRLRVARRWPELDGSVPVSAERFAAADAEVAADFGRVARALQRAG